ncbi:hypothetical protein [uncultured Endozoicomonas sp.]|uniref:hypothetical protein n=1 Tax=uncultured Endozoicomonas sp. TaxID=432652 RepID=UPI00262D764E|nr:hypothetical protein [uncultured Endozoicomonas sp.]
MAGDNVESELAKGIKFFLADTDGTTFNQIPGIQSPGTVGDKGAFKDATTIDLDGYKSKAALAEPEDKELPFKYFKDNTAQDSLRTAAKNMETRKVKVQFTPLGKEYIFEMVFAGWHINEPEFNEDIVMTVFARKNTNVPTVEQDISA